VLPPDPAGAVRGIAETVAPYLHPDSKSAKWKLLKTWRGRRDSNSRPLLGGVNVLQTKMSMDRAIATRVASNTQAALGNQQMNGFSLSLD
jgi:hypothetical protein